MAKKIKPAADPKAQAVLTKTQAFVMERMNRRDIKGAPYNPRTITADAKKRLRENLEKIGHVAPVTVNKTTGNLVGGHQRLTATDAIEGGDNYLIDVAVVELSEKVEKEQNLFLNNYSAQGQFDIDLLVSVLNEPEIDFGAAGFSKVSLEVLLDGTEHLDLLPSILKEAALPGGLDEAVAGLKAIDASADRAKEAAKAAKAAAKEANPPIGPPPKGPDAPRLDEDDESEEDEEEGEEEADEGGEGAAEDAAAAKKEKEIADIKAAKKKARAAGLESNDTETFVVLTFVSREAAMAFQARAGGDPDSRYMDGRLVEKKLDELEALKKTGTASAG